MRIEDIVNIKLQDGYWKGRIIKISEQWEYKLKSGEITIYTSDSNSQGNKW